MCIEKHRVLSTDSLTAIRATEDLDRTRLVISIKLTTLYLEQSVYGSCLIYIVAGMNYIYKSALSRDPCNGTAIFNINTMCAFVYRSERQIQTTSNKTAKKTLPNMATLPINSGLLTVIYYHRCALSDLLFSVMFDIDVFKFFFTARFRRERYV